MSIELLKTSTVKEGLKILGNKAPSMKQNLVTKVKTPILQDKTNLWNIWLDSKTMILYGDTFDYNPYRYRFKIDHSFNLDKIINENIKSNGSIPINPNTYHQSKGREFIIIKQKDIKNAESDYAIRDNKYENKEEYKVNDLEEQGAFKIREHLTPKEVITHNGWKELVVSKNKASKKDYEKASKFLKKYIKKAKEQNCFRDTGMGFYVGTGVDNYEVRPWCVNVSSNRSSADDRYNFDSNGLFLRVRSASKR